MENGSIIGINSKIVRIDDFISSKMDDETIMLNIDKGEYYGINPIGSRIWELLEKPLTILELSNLLINEFDIDIDNCKKDVSVFIQHLQNKNMVKLI